MRENRFFNVATLGFFGLVLAVGSQAGCDARSGRSSDSKSGPEVPAKVRKVLAYVDENGKAPPGYVGGRTFQNREGKLPQTDENGKKIHYREWDVNPKIRGKNRGPERLVTGSNGSGFYTADHYRTFIKIR
jgi:guanyl-specific ribonuclease Sa